ncbi:MULTISPECIES: hypothetical protein [unclassified Enterococcus]|uniref:hypothetical protein n=1 Tax=unclassified Enterococcus TaxID=2608891 RepID=UPI0013E9EB02|nr:MULTISPECIES: hypothetical protein [unclassified Enterococcus]
MEFTETNFPFLMIIMCISLFRIIQLRISTVKLLSKRITEVKSKYPELTKKHLKYRQNQIVKYQRVHFNSKLRNISQSILSFGTIIGIIGALFILIFTKTIALSCLLLALSGYFVSVLLLSRPSMNESYIFWNNYLERNPDNPLKIVLLPKEQAERLFKNERKIGWYLAIVATVFGIFSFFASNLNL